MSIASATDPVKTIRLILEGAADSEWTNDTPETIERVEETTYSRKQRDTRRPALYVWSPEVGTLEKFAAPGDTVHDTEIIRVEIWASSSDRANDYASDVVSIVGGYRNDNEVNTQWVDIWPDTVDDQTAQTPVGSGNSGVISVQVTLMRLFEF